MRSFRGITLRITLLGWFVTIVTLAVFVTVIVPQQEHEFKLNLESKARGVAASIKAVAAGAAISEDYSVVVDQAMQVLAGDEAIDFVVITKNNGYSVVTDRHSWRTETLGEGWRPESRTERSSIGPVPLFGRRLFHYATPFDYSGVEWGWIHVGLSLDTYDESVQRSYWRTGLLAVLCVALSLAFSLYFASRLVRPIHALHTAVEKVAEGDPHARAEVRSGDEIGRLAEAFNDMAATIHARNEILESVAVAAQEFLNTSDWRLAVGKVIESVGKATGASRGYVLEHVFEDGVELCLSGAEWTATEYGPAGAPPALRWRGDACEQWASQLRRRLVVTVKPGDADAREALDGQIKSLILIPVFMGETWWGVMGFDDCVHEREWGEAEKGSLRAVANMLGATIMRQRAQDELIEAKATLEQRVLERTQELQEHVQAKEQAYAELAAAQERLVKLSRQAGMAEVATGVLHNVGNVLNSVNVAATLVREKLEHSRVGKIQSVASLLKEHEADLGEFLSNGEKGKHVVPYLEKLAGYLNMERETMMSELAGLSRHVGHIKEIVAAQQGYATTAGFVEKTSISRLVEDALMLSKDGLERDDIAVTSQMAEMPDVYTDKHKVLQIVLNLLRNARDATRALGNRRKEIHIRVRPVESERFQIAVSDNGVGLAGEDLQRIFQHGFTKKKGGHGFGLHSGALAAQDLGGRLTATSEGQDRGATFVLELPVNTSLREQKEDER